MVRSCPHALDDHPQLKPCFPSRMGDGAPIREGRILGGGAPENSSLVGPCVGLSLTGRHSLVCGFQAWRGAGDRVAHQPC